jgi:hypothetical protein
LEYKRLVLLAFMVALAATLAHAQHANKPGSREQLVFSTEQQLLPVERPVSIPEGALQALRDNEYVRTCLSKGQTPEEIPASWFVGSEIHLDGPDEIDLIVLPNNGCLLGANIGPFWVFRKTPQAYELVLDVHVHDLRVLGTRSNGYRDIRTWSATAVTRTTVLFRFDGHKYQPYQTKSEPIR